MILTFTHEFDDGAEVDVEFAYQVFGDEIFIDWLEYNPKILSEARVNELDNIAYKLAEQDNTDRQADWAERENER